MLVPQYLKVQDKSNAMKLVLICRKVRKYSIAALSLLYIKPQS